MVLVHCVYSISFVGATTYYILMMEDYYIKRNDSVRFDRIILLQAIKNYTMFYLKDGSKIISSLTLKRHEAEFSKRTFLRVNRSTLINPSFVKNVINKNDTNFVKMKNGLKIRVSRRRQDTLASLLS